VAGPIPKPTHDVAGARYFIKGTTISTKTCESLRLKNPKTPMTFSTPTPVSTHSTDTAIIGGQKQQIAAAEAFASRPQAVADALDFPRGGRDENGRIQSSK
jgi:hypothetical protein